MAATTLEITETAGGVRFRVKVVPGASREGLGGTLAGALKMHVAAPPERGKANHAVIALLAACLGVRRNQVTVFRGANSPHKMIDVRGVRASEVLERLA